MFRSRHGNVEKQFKSDLAGDDEDHRVYTWDTSVDIPNGITKDGFVITDEILSDTHNGKTIEHYGVKSKLDAVIDSVKYLV